MDESAVLITAMAEKCKTIVGAWDEPLTMLPRSLQPAHLEWMCERIQDHAEDWPATKLHRWIGFIQCALLANGMVDLDGAKSMFDASKVAHGVRSDELLDHLDPDCQFEFDIGGES